MKPDPEQLEALLSRQADGDLTAEELATLRRVVADDPEAAAAAKQYERLQGLLAGWRCLPADVNWQSFAEDVSGRITEDAEQQASAQLDRAIDPAALPHDAAAPPAGPRMNPAAQGFQATEELLQDWARPLPEVDWAAFSSRVSAAVRREAASDRAIGDARHWRRVARWLAPLAAAACIALVVWANRDAVPTGSRSTEQAAPRVLVALAVPRSAGSVSITFDESPVDTAAAATGGSTAGEANPQGGVAIAIGPPQVTGSKVYDEAYFY